MNSELTRKSGGNGCYQQGFSDHNSILKINTKI